MKFILTRELGYLTRWLRLLGYDAEYFNSGDFKALFILAFSESRIIITKKRAIKDSASLKVVHVKSDLLKKQLSEVKDALKLKLDCKKLFTRCSECNKEVKNVEKESIKDLVPPYVYKTQKTFFQCPNCAKIYWKATHWGKATEFLDEICR